MRKGLKRLFNLVTAPLSLLISILSLMIAAYIFLIYWSLTEKE
jgi:hypothetical protein